MCSGKGWDVADVFLEYRHGLSALGTSAASRWLGSKVCPVGGEPRRLVCPAAGMPPDVTLKPPLCTNSSLYKINPLLPPFTGCV